MTESRFDPALCCVCRSQASGFGYIPPRRVRASADVIAHTCNDFDCLDLAKDTYEMRQDEFTKLEEAATEEGGAAAGSYLESIGKTDLATMTAEEWQAFCRTMVAGYRRTLRDLVKTNHPPF